jgi:hypothetical protein
MNKPYGINELTEEAQKRYGNDENRDLLALIPDMTELLSVQLIKQIIEAKKIGNTSINFVNFWLVSWNEDNEFSASFSATSAARKLTQRFIERGKTVDSELELYFQQTLSRKRNHMQLLLDMTSCAQKNGSVYDSKIKTGKNVAYLFRVTFSTLLYLTFEKEGTVHLPGIGHFERKFKIKKKNASKQTHGGVLQFEPDIKI